MTITGTNFTGATAVNFGANAATAFTVVNATTITATAPAGTAGTTVEVTVTTPSGTNPTPDGTGNDYTYDAVVVVPAISIDNQTVTEGGTANFTVSLDQATTQTVTVNFATANNTATAPGDYTAASGTLTFAPGVLTQPVSVSTNTDNLVEGTETFAVNLSNATNATIADAIGVGTILDGTTPAPTVTALNPTHGLAAGGNSVTITGTNFTGATAVNFGANAATAFTVVNATTITATAPAGTAGTTVEVTVTTPSGTNPTPTAPATTTPMTRWSSYRRSRSTMQTVTEGGTANFTVSLDQATTQTVTVNFATANNTATAPGDYTAASGTLTFAPGVLTQPVTVSTNTDNLLEGTETFDVNLSTPTNATILDGTGVGTILDGTVDQPPVSNAGPDQTVSPGDTVTLNGTGSSDPNGEALTYMWTAPAGITLSDPTSPTPTFTAPDVTDPTDLTFSLDVCDEGGTTANPDVLCSDPDATVTIHVVPVVLDATGDVIVNGPVSSRKTSKSFVFKVSNIGMAPFTINQSNITGSVNVNGSPTGSVSVSPFTKTLNPGASTRVKLDWSYAAGSLVTGNTVDFNACVTVTGDIDTTNDCGTASATAK